MSIRPISVAAVFAAGFLTTRPFGCAQPARTDGKPVVTLKVNLTSLTIARQNGLSLSPLDAASSGGFSGTISGTMSVSQPINSSGIVLSAGSGGQSFPFTLAADQKTSDTKPRETGTFTIKTSPNNATSGTFIYIINIDPSAQFMIDASPA